NCSNCHQIGHRKNHCSTEKCLTSQACGKVKLHKEELKKHDLLKVKLKKLNKEKNQLESEALKIQDTIVATNRTFHERVRTTLINSNKQKYLTLYGNEIVPLTKLINLDLSILQKHYRNKVPDDLQSESHQFSYIIDGQMEQFNSMKTSINSKLLDSVRRVDNRIRDPANVTDLVSQGSVSQQQVNTPVSILTESAVSSHNYEVNSVTNESDALPLQPTFANFTHICGTPKTVSNPFQNIPLDSQQLNASSSNFVDNGGSTFIPFKNVSSATASRTASNESGSWYSIPQEHKFTHDVKCHHSSKQIKREVVQKDDGQSSLNEDSTDYSTFYDQFNVKPKTEFIKRYSQIQSEGRDEVLAHLHEPPLD
ncbi:MAG: hypothetical protein MJE68_12475, partial [Proteobacteria bacterium]|nr:hypothetical protein [Pseudomonadota bacterium]